MKAYEDWSLADQKKAILIAIIILSIGTLVCGLDIIFPLIGGLVWIPFFFFLCLDIGAIFCYILKSSKLMTTSTTFQRLEHQSWQSYAIGALVTFLTIPFRFFIAYLTALPADKLMFLSAAIITLAIILLLIGFAYRDLKKKQRQQK